MICYLISTKGGQEVLAGHPDMEQLQFSLFYDDKAGSPHCIVSAKLRNTDGKIAAAEWHSTAMEVGEEVRIKVVDSDSPDKPERQISFGTIIHPIGNEELFCSFCGRSQKVVGQMIRGPAANACDECIGILGDSLD